MMSKEDPLELYAGAAVIGVMKGYTPVPHQLEVEVVAPHSEAGLPGFGEFLLVELSANAALVGRVCHYHAAGQLVGEKGDAYLADLARNQEEVPSAIRRQMLRHHLRLQLLGHLQLDPRGDSFKFSVGERAFAILGANVRPPSAAALGFLCNVGLENDASAVPLGHLVYGQRELPEVPVNFSVSRLKDKRSFVFARAGYGKSNLIKYLVSQMFASPPEVGLLIFDPEGEYALPDAQGRPGLANVPALAPRLSLYSNRRVDPDYTGLHRGASQVDFGDFPPHDIVAAFVPPEKQETVFANVLRSLDWKIWRRMVALLAADGFAADDKKLAAMLSFKARDNDVILAAIKNNLVPPLRRLHQPGAPLGRNIIEELKQKRVVIVDVSLTGGEDGQAVISLLLRRIMAHNVRHLTDLEGPTVRCVAIIEEAQNFLSERTLSERDVFVRWVKEGRKYGLGAVLVTQQPSSIASQIISQGDNFFVMHLLNDGDLATLKRHNAYFSDDILAYLRHEPIPGNCYFWSAPNQPFVLPARVRNFEQVCHPRRPAPPTARAAEGTPASWEALAGRVVKELIAANHRLWLYPVARPPGDKAAGRVAFSQDYLASLAAQNLARQVGGDAQRGFTEWMQNRLPRELEKILARHHAQAGYAVLEGILRPVWVLPETEIRLAGGKTLRPDPVEVRSRW